ncbi:LysM peptidoglycan-binding domain-containing protein [Mucilaginibacter achroorhodeus]|uniref:LysM peptidoglycan-binding domain-containing protein n=1 Tax=Mucilaginibacter achroorhodeus TaxID=2599294 RepID=A0A563U4B4_9SPHI|nr:LysM peptidoglycan-binding domain-containing protein [Mucilaginibacter achroorhodeus]TWR26181.1 LysM peptidoglycan-binding domain-containing protein [Mucilaginibacter achroorhodeus]
MRILKKLLISSSLMVISAATFAGAMPADSIGVENNNGKKVILHKLDPKDNYYSIGRRYGVSPKVIQQFNNNASLQIGHIIKVPTERSIVESTGPAPKTEQQAQVKSQAKPVTTPPVTNPVQQQPQTPVKKEEAKTSPVNAQQPAPVQQQQTAPQQPAATQQQYKVSAHETLYSIAKRFGTTVDAITSLNKLSNTNLTPGQVLLVPNGVQPAQAQQDATATPVAHQDISRGDSSTIAADSLNRHISSKYGLFEKNEKGVATWIDDTSLDPNKKLILHRTAPIGTVMRITNPMNGKVTFAKVVGRFTDSESTRDAIVVMTKNVASALGALDKRFQVNISYGTPNE